MSAKAPAKDGTRRGRAVGSKNKAKRKPVTKKALVEWQKANEVITRPAELPLLSEFRTNFSIEEILSAVLAYTLLGTTGKAEEVSGIKAATIRSWKKDQPWWDEAIAYCRKIKQDELDAKLTRVIHKAAETIETELDARRLTAKEAVGAFGTVFDKRNLLRGDPTNIRKERTDTDATMATLKQQFEQMSRDIRDRLPPSRVITGEVEDGS